MTDSKAYENLTAEQQLNFYRNKYYTEGNHTEKGIIANAINDILPKYVRQKAEIERLEERHLSDDKLLNDRVQEAINAVSKANQKYVDALEKGFNDRTAELKIAKSEIERLNEELSKERRKALLEATSKFEGHSDYHGDTILCKLICMAEGKEVEAAKPIDKSEIK